MHDQERPRRSRRLGIMATFVVIMLAAACTSEPDNANEGPAPAAAVTPAPVATAPLASPVPTAAVPTVSPANALPTVTPVALLGPALLPAGLAAAAPGTFLRARDDAGLAHENGGRVIPVYDEPSGEPRILVEQNDIGGVKNPYLLIHPTVFNQPLVLRVIAGTEQDEWLLVQAPVRPHRQSVWVRSEDFDIGRTDLRIEIDLAHTGRFALFNGRREVVSNAIVFGRESRPTVLHDTYVEQIIEGPSLSPAYGTYVLTIASYSEALGTFGGGMPGQSIHGTNQPELMGQRVSSGGIRMPNEVIDFVQAQPGIIGASVVIYDSSGIGRDAAIALQRSEPWSPALTADFPEPPFGPGLIASYS